MREVNPDNQNAALKNILDYLIEFVKNPLQKIAQLPDWNWTSIIIVQITIAVASGVLAGLIKFNLYRIASGIFLMPFVSTISSSLLSIFFYYYFQFFENRTESFRKLFILVILTSIPFYIFQIISEYFAPITLIGVGFTCLLGIVGLTENFGVAKRRSTQLMGFIFGLTVLTWIFILQAANSLLIFLQPVGGQNLYFFG